MRVKNGKLPAYTYPCSRMWESLKTKNKTKTNKKTPELDFPVLTTTVRGNPAFVLSCFQMKPLHEVDFAFRLTIFCISSAFLVVSGLMEVSNDVDSVLLMMVIRCKRIIFVFWAVGQLTTVYAGCFGS